MKLKLLLITALAGVTSLAFANHTPWTLATKVPSTVKVFYANSSIDKNPQDLKRCQTLLEPITDSHMSVAYQASKFSAEKAKMTYLGATTTLYPIGLKGQYAFMSEGVSSGLAQQNLIRLGFSVSNPNQPQSLKAYALFKSGKAGVNCKLLTD